MASLHNALLFIQWFFLITGFVGFAAFMFLDDFTWYHSMLSAMLGLLSLIALKIEVVAFTR